MGDVFLVKFIFFFCGIFILDRVDGYNAGIRREARLVLEQPRAGLVVPRPALDGDREAFLGTGLSLTIIGTGSSVGFSFGALNGTSFVCCSGSVAFGFCIASAVCCGIWACSGFALTVSSCFDSNRVHPASVTPAAPRPENRGNNGWVIETNLGGHLSVDLSDFDTDDVASLPAYDELIFIRAQSPSASIGSLPPDYADVPGIPDY